MNYDDLGAKELRALCEKRGIKPSRAKADMIEDLKARDAADELTQLTQDLGLDEPLTASDVAPVPEVVAEPERPADGPVAAPDEPYWVEQGVFLKKFPRNPNLDSWEHEANLRDVQEHARAEGFVILNPPRRVSARTTPSHWVYGINVRI